MLVSPQPQDQQQAGGQEHNCLSSNFTVCGLRRRQAMSVEGGAAAMDDASCDASSMAFSPPASIAPIRTHFEAVNRQVTFYS